MTKTESGVTTPKTPKTPEPNKDLEEQLEAEKQRVDMAKKMQLGLAKARQKQLEEENAALQQLIDKHEAGTSAENDQIPKVEPENRRQLPTPEALAAAAAAPAQPGMIGYINPLQLQAFASQFLPKFDGKTRGQLRLLVDTVNKYQAEWGMTDRQTASFAVYAFPASSDALKWYQQCLSRDIPPNMHLWPNLRTALGAVYGTTSDLATIQRRLNEAMYQKPHTTTNAYKVDLDQALFEFLEYILDPTWRASPLFFEVHERALFFFMKNGIHEDMKRELKATWQTYLTPSALAKAATDVEAALGLVGGNLYRGRPQNQQQVKAGTSANPYQVYASNAQEEMGRPAESAAPQVAAATSSSKPKICDYCGIKNSHNAEDCNTREADRKNGNFWERCADYPKKTYAEKRKEERKRKKEEKAKTVAAVTSHPPPTHPPGANPNMPAFGGSVAAATLGQPPPAASPRLVSPRGIYVPNGATPPTYYTAPYLAGMGSPLGGPAPLPEVQYDPYYAANAAQNHN